MKFLHFLNFIELKHMNIILQQILYVVPHFYILKYIEKKKKSTFNINDEFNKDYDLIIDIPDDNRKQLGDKSKEMFTKTFLDKNVVKEFESLYNQVLG